MVIKQQRQFEVVLCLVFSLMLVCKPALSSCTQAVLQWQGSLTACQHVADDEHLPIRALAHEGYHMPYDNCPI